MKNPSRKYIDLIHSTSSKWANWNPPNQIKVGDYGLVNRETGEFEKDGNIYDDEATAELMAHHPPQLGTPENIMIASSRGVKHRELALEADLGVPGLADTPIKGQWEFGNKRGALLIVARPQSAYIPHQVVLKHLVNIPALQHKSLVTEVVSCPAYSLYLSTANKDVVDLALVGTIPHTPPATPSGEIRASWWAQNRSGLFRDACDTSGSNSYTPLYALKKIWRPGIFRRESPVPDREDDDLWVKSQEPWNPLDEDGEEEEYEDTVFD